MRLVSAQYALTESDTPAAAKHSYTSIGIRLNNHYIPLRSSQCFAAAGIFYAQRAHRNPCPAGGSAENLQDRYTQEAAVNPHQNEIHGVFILVPAYNMMYRNIIRRGYMIYFIIGIILFCLITFVLFCILHCSTLYDRMTDDEQQEKFLRRYMDK